MRAPFMAVFIGLAATLLGPAPAARAEVWVGPTAAYVGPEGASRAGFELGVLASFPRFGDRWSVDASLDHWTWRQGAVETRDFVAATHVLFHVTELGSPADVALGAGPSLHFIRIEYSHPSFSYLPASKTHGGVDFTAQVGIPLSGRVDLVFRSVYTIIVENVNLEDADANRYITVGGGVRFALGR